MSWVGMLAEFADEPGEASGDAAGAVERRGAARRRLRLESLLTGQRPPAKIVVLDLSQAGLMLYATAPLDVGDRFAVDLPIAGSVDATVVWKRNELFGCEFDSPVSRGVVSATLLRATCDQLGGN